MEGLYRNKRIENTTFPLVKGYQPYPHKQGGFVTVHIDDMAKYQAPADKIRISVESESMLRDKAPEERAPESDEEVIERMRKRFAILDDMTKATKRGDVRAMIVSGPPGVGKTSLAKKGIADCLKDETGQSRPFAFIAIGGSSNGSTLDGHNYTYVGSTWGRIAEILMDKKCMNPIIFIDELDKVKMTKQIYAKIQKLRDDHAAALSELAELKRGQPVGAAPAEATPLAAGRPFSLSSVMVAAAARGGATFSLSSV